MKIIEELKMIAALNLHDTLEEAEVSTIREAADLLEEALKALEPFAQVAYHDIGSDEEDSDIFRPMGKHNHAPLLRVGDLRHALAILTKSQGEKIDG